jgi:peptide/nickel transport system substrate-binding protein
MLARNPDYWGHSLPVNQGVNNFDNITYEYFRDDAALFEAFKTGHISVFRENNVMRWKNSYNFPAAQKKKVFREEIPHQRPSGMYGFVFNTRKDLFQDIRVRKALALALDFTWINKTLFGGEYQHIRSYFDNSPLASPKGAAQGLERELLLPFQAELPEQTIEAGWSSPKGAGDGNNRENLRSASKMLEKSGWHIRNNHLTGQNGQVFSFEILVHTSEDERVASIFSHMLRLLGIEMRVRLLDDSSYQEKLKSFDFDMIIHKWWLSLSPGTEQRIYWSGEVANTPGSRNYPGIHSNAVDHLIDVMTTTHDEAVYTNSVRALDRVLSSGVYVIPLWFSKYDRLARWDGYHKPEHPKLYGYNPDVWWYDK